MKFKDPLAITALAAMFTSSFQYFETPTVYTKIDNILLQSANEIGAPLDGENPLLGKVLTQDQIETLRPLMPPEIETWVYLRPVF